MLAPVTAAAAAANRALRGEASPALTATNVAAAAAAAAGSSCLCCQRRRPHQRPRLRGHPPQRSPLGHPCCPLRIGVHLRHVKLCQRVVQPAGQSKGLCLPPRRETVRLAETPHLGRAAAPLDGLLLPDEGGGVEPELCLGHSLIGGLCGAERVHSRQVPGRAGGLRGRGPGQERLGHGLQAGRGQGWLRRGRGRRLGSAWGAGGAGDAGVVARGPRCRAVRGRYHCCARCCGGGCGGGDI